jgi:hypothetical protein
VSFRENFRDIVKASLKDERLLKKWHYVSWRTKDGQFLASAVVEAENRIDAARVADNLCDMSYEEVQLGTFDEIPEKDLPSEEYRNRKLTREEVEKLWATNE